MIGGIDVADWSPSSYLRFADERTRPARDLLAQVPLRAARQVVDMGCGPGNSTALLVDRFPGAEVRGLDSSPAMLDSARKALPDVRFEIADAASWTPSPGVDLLFANAIYQWVPDHLAVLRRQFEALQAGAVLAVQMPDNLAEPTHRLMATIASAGPWAARLAGAPRDPLPPVGAYYDALAPLGGRIEIWHTIFNHVLAGPEAVVDWVKSTGLRPFLDPLTETERTAYLDRYTEAIAAIYPRQADGRVLLTFPRLFLLAIRA